MTQQIPRQTAPDALTVLRTASHVTAFARNPGQGAHPHPDKRLADRPRTRGTKPTPATARPAALSAGQAPAAPP